MLVSLDNYESVCLSISAYQHAGMDCETTGVNPYKSDQLFSFGIALPGDEAYYFNFQEYEGLDSKYVLDGRFLPLLRKALLNKILFLHNAKFDMSFLAKAGLDISDMNIYCTYAGARVEYNDHITLTLDAMMENIGLAKSDAVKKYCDKHKLYTVMRKPGAKKTFKKYHFDRVPFDIMWPYCLIDCRGTLEVGLEQMASITRQDSIIPEGLPRLVHVLDNEIKLTRTLYFMEKVGVKIDTAYAREAFKYEESECKRLEEEFTEKTGLPFKDHRATLEPAFIAAGEPYAKTLIGNASFKQEVLEKMKSPLAQLLLAYRAAHGRAGVFGSFLYHCDANGVVHANAKQAGTVTGRMSYAEPNFQSCEKVDDEEALSQKYLIRRCLVPRENYIFLMIDYKTMEYSLMLDYAGEEGLIEKVKAGLDVHQATADMIGTTRQQAKRINFAILYGMGKGSLGDLLGITEQEADLTMIHYFAKLRKVSEFIKNVKATAKKRGFLFNWYGRRYVMKKEFTYRGPNYLIQGGCADIVKVAMNKLQDLLGPTRSRMVLQVHDELLFEIHKEEWDLVPKIKEIMESVYPYKQLPLRVDVSYSETSWQEKTTVAL